jgi:hypothetical protein
MPQEKTFQLQLKNDQTIELKFSSIDATNGQLWQMFATTEALDTVQLIIDQGATQTSSARKVVPVATDSKPSKKKK